MNKKTILIVEDNLIISYALMMTLKRLGYIPFDPVVSGEDALAAVTRQQPDLVLMDVNLDGNLDGIATAQHIQAIAPIPVIYLTGNSHDERLTHAACLSKPVIEKELVLMIEKVLGQSDE